MTPQELHTTLEKALDEKGPDGSANPAAAWPVFRDVCVAAAKALPAGELDFCWDTEDECDGHGRFYVEFRCTNWWIKEPWLDDPECDLWWVVLAFTRPADAASELLGSGDHRCYDFENPDTFPPAVEALGILPATQRLDGWTKSLTWERDEDQD